jgi:hypothetical protein
MVCSFQLKEIFALLVWKDGWSYSHLCGKSQNSLGQCSMLSVLYFSILLHFFLVKLKLHAVLHNVTFVIFLLFHYMFWSQSTILRCLVPKAFTLQLFAFLILSEVLWFYMKHIVVKCWSMENMDGAINCRRIKHFHESAPI